MADLGEWLSEQGARRREPGIWDCCAMPAEWAVACGRPDPMARWRGTYGTDAEAEERITEAGGLTALFAMGMEDAGIREVSDPQAGDIGVIMIGGEEAGAVFTGRRWAFVPGGRGLAIGSVDPASIIRIWRP
ncbi:MULTISPECIES: DUF6950 family protein [unclassified Sphingomonas]|uniref:DUF6950 family protein n=1 Tax=unclassified Sphingomonas TaxID=196159 RepID=UPI0006FC9F41|nr:MULTISPECIES: hypothetical protein [unclassified Sphingomonas]KQX18425.1 hypothetical protein ASD17_14785 [Sphingomonas sp. Root1294]KQY72250.1 hypothetical protein ASD39_20190 [Sphingomonas sp. Root50]KRB94479.1 hypothetical protein ASE22_00560 [Sphingomonas sp. Root720]